MRISDWSSDVCSSDLDRPPLLLRQPEVGQRARAGPDIAYEVGDPLPGDIHTVEVAETGSHQPREPVAVTQFQQERQGPQARGDLQRIDLPLVRQRFFAARFLPEVQRQMQIDRKSTRLNYSQ